MVSPFGGEHGWRNGKWVVRIVLALGAAALLAGLPELLTLSVGPDADLSGRLGLAGGVGTVTFAVLFSRRSTDQPYAVRVPAHPHHGQRVRRPPRRSNRARSVALSATYVGGIALTYSGARRLRRALREGFRLGALVTLGGGGARALPGGAGGEHVRRLRSEPPALAPPGRASAGARAGGSDRRRRTCSPPAPPGRARAPPPPKVTRAPSRKPSRERGEDAERRVRQAMPPT